MSALFLTHWPRVDRPAEGKLLRTSTTALASAMARPKTYACKGDLPRWAPAQFRDHYRCNDRMTASFGVVADVDAPLFAEVLAALDGLHALVHTTWRGNVRAFLPTDRPMRSPEEHRRVARFALGRIEQAGITPDYSSVVASQAWAVPAASKDYRFVELQGAALSVEIALETVPAETRPPVDVERPVHGDDLQRRLRRASAYLARVDSAVSGAGGHATTFRAVLDVIIGFDIPADAAFELLRAEYNPRCDPPWSDRELRHKCRQAGQRGRRERGYLANERRSA